MTGEKFFNRELSWIEFNARVLNEAGRNELPLFERLNFLAITSSNFDEFFQVRVFSVKRLEKKSPLVQDTSGFTPSAALRKISERSHQLIKTQDEILHSDILPALAKEGFVYVRPEKYSASQKTFTENYFKREIFPLLTPLRTDSPQYRNIGNLTTNVAFLLERMNGLHAKKNQLSPKENAPVLALCPIPSSIKNIIYLNNESGLKVFTLLEDIILFYGKELFPGYQIKESMIFRVNRDADMAVNEKEDKNFIQEMEKILVNRQSSYVVRMICTSSSQTIKNILKEKFSLSDQDIYEVKGITDISVLLPLTECEEAQKYTYPEWKHFYSSSLPKEGTYWDTIRQNDVLLNLPYESFDPIVKFIHDAAEDEKVLAIKMTLYRTGSNSPIIEALKNAAQKGKQVTVFVELKARFDEKRNIRWVQELEKSGVIVIYGVVNLKVHAKICLVVRKESDGMRRYVHLSTGNYNYKTGRLYQDLSLFTSNTEIANDATLFFNIISGYSALQQLHHLYMAPVTLKSRLLEMIDREIKLSSPQNPGHIVAKMNSLTQKEIISALYKASQVGVKIELNVRGICTLVPGIKGLSENIKVVSIVDRYLEHSRIFYFNNGGAEEIYLSSADWMDRNLDRRIELMFPLMDKKTSKLAKEILMLYFQDNTQSHVLQSNGMWKKIECEKKELPVRVQEVLYKKYMKKDEANHSSPKLEFVVRRN